MSEKEVPLEPAVLGSSSGVHIALGQCRDCSSDTENRVRSKASPLSLGLCLSFNKMQWKPCKTQTSCASDRNEQSITALHQLNPAQMQLRIPTQPGHWMKVGARDGTTISQHLNFIAVIWAPSLSFLFCIVATPAKGADVFRMRCQRSNSSGAFFCHHLETGRELLPQTHGPAPYRP